MNLIHVPPGDSSIRHVALMLSICTSIIASATSSKGEYVITELVCPTRSARILQGLNCQDFDVLGLLGVSS